MCDVCVSVGGVHTEHECCGFASLSSPAVGLDLEGVPGLAQLLSQLVLLREQAVDLGL